MKVYLLAHTPDPEKLIAGAAKLCYSGAEIQDLLDGISQESAVEFVEMLASLGHDSPTEHASFTFAIEGVSRVLLSEITRHRMASFSVQSQRYVRLDNFAFVTPPAIAGDPEAAEIYQASMQKAAAEYVRLAAILKETHYQAFLQEGDTEKQARQKAEKRAIEDARFVLPGACETKMIVTMNTRSLQNFFRLRCCARAQWEIRALATEMLRLVHGVAPALFAASGPPCARGACTEGKMTCGKSIEVRARFDALKRGEPV